MIPNRRTAQMDPAPPRGRPSRRTSDQTDDGPPLDEVWVGAIGAWIPQGWCASHPLIAGLIGEDLAWRIATADWQSRPPSRWSFGARRTWRGEGRRLREKRARLVVQAAEMGIRAVEAKPKGKAKSASTPRSHDS